ncbi:MAG: hypothetical protein HY456_00300 [Parcubacteria group bacterium]|nr:hypothetical protein [Parcubacteria group bacterium]
MKAALIIFLITGFIAIAVFGVFAMGHGNEHSHNGCIAATAQGTDCPKEEGAFSFIAFHLEAFRSFSTATFGNNLASVLLLLIVSVLNVAVALPAFATDHRRGQFLESYSPPFQRELTRWLALHENSPAVL